MKTKQYLKQLNQSIFQGQTRASRFQLDESNYEGKLLASNCPFKKFKNFMSESECYDLKGFMEKNGNIYNRAGKPGATQYSVIKLRSDKAFKNPLFIKIANHLKESMKNDLGMSVQVNSFSEFTLIRYENKFDTFGYHVDRESIEEIRQGIATKGYINSRSATITIDLSGHKEYTHGGFSIAHPEFELEITDKGDACVFDAGLLHTGMPITSGKRYILVAWALTHSVKQELKKVTEN